MTVFVFGVVLVFAGIVGAGAENPRPNVLFVVFDDLNDWVGALGDRQVKTPNLDAFAKKGVLFTNAHCVASVCNPSRVAILTGLRPETTGVFSQGQRLRDLLPGVVTLPDWFRKHGYLAVGVGKVFDIPDPASWDDYFFWDPGAMESEGVERYYEPPAPQPLVRPATDLSRKYGANIDFAPLDEAESAMPDHQVVDLARKFLWESHDKPFFLAVGIHKPHLPWFTPRRYFEQYPLTAVEPPELIESDLADVPDYGKRIALSKAGSSFTPFSVVEETGLWKAWIQAYLASVTFADAQFGRLMEALREGPNVANTVIVVCSDHGFHHGEKEHLHKYTLWERSTHVPLMISARNVGSEGVRIQQPVSLLDLFPTLIDLCRIDAPGDVAIEGHSLIGLLEDPTRNWPYAAVTSLDRGSASVRTAKWRYIRYADGGEELYDHTNDPHEWVNLVDRPESQSIIVELAKHLPASKLTPP
ncbi:MAG: sulfatase [Opitutaceae bacterium]